MHRWLIMTGLLTLVLTPGLRAQDARIEGSVVAAGSDRPLDAARLRLPGLDRETRSDADGHFLFREVPVGRWRLEAELSGHRPRGFTVEVPRAGVVRVVVELTPRVLGAETPSTGTVRGTVRTEGSLEPVPYATIETGPGERGVLADQRGFFVLADLPAGEAALRISAAGHRPASRRVEVPAGGTATLTIPLSPAPVELEGIEVEGTRGGVRREGPGPGFDRVDAGLIERLPAAAETDVIRSLQILPSVQPMSDFSSALYVRGGSSDQTLITLDGVPVFNPYHLGGIFSAVDPETVATVDVHPGALPAPLGDRLSGAVEIWTREGGKDRVRGQGGVSLISTRAGVDGPLGDGTFLLSLRRTYLDLLTGMADLAGFLEQPVPYHFTDAHLKLTRPMGSTGTLTGSFYVDSEELTNRDPTSTSEGPSEDDHFGWGSRVLSLGHRQLLGDHLLLETKAGFSSFRGEAEFFDARAVLGMEELQIFRTVRGRAYMRDAVAQAGLTGYGRSHRLRAGIRVDGYLLDYDVERSDGFYEDVLPPFRSRRTLTTVAAYLEDVWRPVDRVQARVGGRVLTGAGDVAWMPRLGLTVGLTSSLSLRVGGGAYAQALQSLRNEESHLSSFLAYDLLTPVDSLGFARSWDMVLGLEWRDDRTRIEADAYQKAMSDLPLPPLPSDPLEAPVIVTEGFLRGTGRTRGVEISARREWGQAGAVQLSYALSDGERTVDGVTWTPRQHRRHFIDLLATRSWGDGGSLSARVLAATGQPTTPVLGRFGDLEYDPIEDRYQEGFEGGFLLGRHNSRRLPGYWRVDVAARRDFQKRWFGREVTLTPYLQITNLFNTRNVLVARPQNNFYRPTGDEPGAELEYLPMIPILPTFGVEWRF